MHHAGPMRSDERSGDGLGNAEFLAVVEPLAHGRAQSAAFDELQDEEIGVLTIHVIENAADCRVIQLRKGSRLADEPIAGALVEAMVRADGLQRDAPLQGLIPPFIDLSHTAPSEDAHDSVMPGTVTNNRHALPRWFNDDEL
jgi:hypothetical protein